MKVPLGLSIFEASIDATNNQSLSNTGVFLRHLHPRPSHGHSDPQGPPTTLEGSEASCRMVPTPVSAIALPLLVMRTAFAWDVTMS